MKEFLLLKEMGNFIEESIAKENKCKRCHWPLWNDEETFCDSCVETMHKDDIEKDSDALQDKRVKKNNSKVEK
jgi:hypothetical protein